MLYGVAVILSVILLVVIGVQVWHVVVAYRAATGTKWQRFLAAFSQSATILVARLGAISSAIFAWAINFFPSLDPTSGLGQALAAVLKPQYVPFYALAFALVVEAARRSKGSVDPITAPAIKG